MKLKNSMGGTGIAACVLGAAVALALTGCADYASAPRDGAQTSVFAPQDDYIYYPQYECYYSVSRHQYAYREGNQWVLRPELRGVPTAVLRTSPSVPMNFHDSPAQHHDSVVKQYPKNWTRAEGGQGENRK